VPDDWELSPPTFAAPHSEQLATDLTERSAGERTQQALQRPTAAPEGYRAHALHHANWSRREIGQHPGTVSEMAFFLSLR